MWALDNATPFAAERTWTRDRDGRHQWIVVVKATYLIEPDGALRLADEQLPPLAEPEYRGEPGQSSLRYDADLTLAKPGTDVVVNASAHAPNQRPVRELPVELRVGELRKQLLVRGPSSFSYGALGARASSPEPFVTRPVIYEHAYGGSDLASDDPRQQFVDTRNPVGAGAAARDEHLHGRPAPSVFYPRGAPDRVGPAGFGPIASHWSPRRELAGTYDTRWAQTRRPLLPRDYDPTHLLCSPVDQRLQTRLRGGERVTLVNLTPAGVLALRLPTIELRGHARIRGQNVGQRFELATVIIDGDESRLIMVWHSALGVRAKDVEQLSRARVDLVSG